MTPLKYFLLLCLTTLTLSSQTVREDIDVLHRGSANTITVHNGSIYLSGNFTGVGPYSSCGAVVDPDSGILKSGWPKINSEVFVSLSDKKGGWFVGGIFSTVGGMKRSKVAYINADRSVNSEFFYEASGEIYALAKLGDTLFIGGYFPERLIAVNIKTNKRIPNWTPSFPGDYKSVQHLVLNDSVLGAVGDFETVNGQQRNHFALLNAKTGALLPHTQNDIAFPNRLLLKDSLLFVNIVEKDSIGKENKFILAKKFQSNTIVWKQKYEGNVYGYTLYDSALYISGENLLISDSSKGIVTINYLTGEIYNWKTTMVRSVTRMSVTPKNILCAYYDTTFSFDRKTGLNADWNPNPNATVRSINFDGNNVFIGGEFSTLNPKTRNGFAVINEISGKLLPIDYTIRSKFPFQSMNIVNSMIVKDSILYFGGSFDSINNEARRNFAAVDLKQHKILPTAISFSDTMDIYSTIRSMAIIDSTIFIGGRFAMINKQHRNNLAAFSLIDGKLLDWSPNPNGPINILKNINSNLYVGGSFDSINGQLRSGIAAIKGLTLTNWKPKLLDQTYNGTVNDIIEFEKNIYLCGVFNSVDSTVRNNLASFDLSTGDLTSWNPKSNGGVAYLAATKNSIITLGSYTINGIYQNGVFALSPSDGTVRIGWNPWPTLGVGPAASSDNYLYLTGGFIQVGPIPLNHRRINGFAGISLPNATSIPLNDKIIIPKFILQQNYPNPFNPVTTIAFTIPTKSYVELKVIDILGRDVDLLINETREAGNYSVQFNAAKFPSGIYFYRIKSDDNQIVKKMILLK